MKPSSPLLRALALFTLLLLVTACGGAPKPDAPVDVPAPEAAPLPDELVPDASGRVEITVDGMGYHPATVHARAGQTLTLVFTRIVESACVESIRIPSTGFEAELPIGQPVAVQVTADSDLAFTCGMDMLRGRVVVHGVRSE